MMFQMIWVWHFAVFNLAGALCVGFHPALSTGKGASPKNEKETFMCVFHPRLLVADSGPFENND